jgi:hypothetical protein
VVPVISPAQVQLAPGGRLFQDKQLMAVRMPEKLLQKNIYGRTLSGLRKSPRHHHSRVDGNPEPVEKLDSHLSWHVSNHLT